MKVREVLKVLFQLHRFDLIQFNDFGMAPVGYLLGDLMKYVDTNDEPIMDAPVDRFETRNNVVTLYGPFKDYLKEAK